MQAAGKRYIAHGSRSNSFTVWNLSDIHLGNRACAVDTVKRDIERIRKDPTAFWLGGGDYAEYIGAQDKRFDPDAVAESLTVADMGKLGLVLTSRVRDLFKPIAHKCLGLLMGNHERHYERWTEQTGLHAWLCNELQVPNLQYSAFFDVVFCRCPGVKAPRLQFTYPPNHCGQGKSSYRFMVHHGAGFATTPAGKLKRLIDFMERFDADVVMCGHVHDQKGQRLVRIGADKDCTTITAKESIGVISGSYLRTYAQGVTTYGEQKGYAPVPLGASFVRITPMAREVKDGEREITGEV